VTGFKKKTLNFALNFSVDETLINVRVQVRFTLSLPLKKKKKKKILKNSSI